VVSDEEGPRWATLRPWFLQLGLPLLAAVILLGCVLVLGGWARDWLRGHGSVTVRFADIDCPSPPGQTRQAFLADVQFLAGLPDELDTLDEASVGLVREAFRKHLWVREVKNVSLGRGNAIVELVFRVPVLYVEAWKRAVDSEGALLPTKKADANGLFVLKQAVPKLKGLSTDDPDVRCAVAVAGLLNAHRARLGLEGAEVQVADGQVDIIGRECRIFWGHPPGKEQGNEPPAQEKVRRLLTEGPLHGRMVNLREP
jgi:hypothetical protein